MRRKAFAGAAAALLAVFMLAPTCFVGRHHSQSNQPLMSQMDNNPQKFHLWSTGSSFSYTFTCDPRAADTWLFKSGGGTMFVLRSPADSGLPLTNHLDPP
jgi:hypothetical protein